MIETRKDMSATLHEVNQQSNYFLQFPQLDMMKQFESVWLFGFFSACLPVLKCVEDSSTIKEPELQANLIRSSQNVMLAPPQFPLIACTGDNASTSTTVVQAFSNETEIKNHTNDRPDLELLVETKSEIPQADESAPECETPKKYISGQQHSYKIERTSPKPFQTFASSSTGSTSTTLTCMRWTPELHDHFVEAIHHLGGSKKATPSGILKFMKVEGLTIDHVESHLQEFSSQQKQLDAQGSYESSQEEGFETKNSQTEETASLRVVMGDIDINEVFKIQMEVQKQLHEHLEMQRKLQMRIQERGKHLKKMIEQQHLNVDQQHASSLSSFSSNSYDDCIKERVDQTRNFDKCDTMLQN